MRSLVSWFVYNPVAANMLMILILFAGLLSALNIRVEGFPKIPADTIEVNVVQVGASAQQMHQSVTTSGQSPRWNKHNLLSLAHRYNDPAVHRVRPQQGQQSERQH